MVGEKGQSQTGFAVQVERGSSTTLTLLFLFHEVFFGCAMSFLDQFSGPGMGTGRLIEGTEVGAQQLVQESLTRSLSNWGGLDAATRTDRCQGCRDWCRGINKGGAGVEGSAALRGLGLPSSLRAYSGDFYWRGLLVRTLFRRGRRTEVRGRRGFTPVAAVILYHGMFNARGRSATEANSPP